LCDFEDDEFAVLARSTVGTDPCEAHEALAVNRIPEIDEAVDLVGGIERKAEQAALAGVENAVADVDEDSAEGSSVDVEAAHASRLFDDEQFVVEEGDGVNGLLGAGRPRVGRGRPARGCRLRPSR